MAAAVELRCPANPSRLFAKVVTERPLTIVEGNLIEVACRDCAKDRGVRRVLHRFDVTGELIETEVLR